MKNKQKKETEKNEKQLTPEQEEQERMDLLRRAAETPGKQLQFDSFKNELKEVDELRELIGAQFENPEEKYQAYYNGMRKVLMQYLPSGKDFLSRQGILYTMRKMSFLIWAKRSQIIMEFVGVMAE